jgi:hypothetical protein
VVGNTLRPPYPWEQPTVRTAYEAGWRYSRPGSSENRSSLPLPGFLGRPTADLSAHSVDHVTCGTNHWAGETEAAVLNSAETKIPLGICRRVVHPQDRTVRNNGREKLDCYGATATCNVATACTDRHFSTQSLPCTKAPLKTYLHYASSYGLCRSRWLLANSSVIRFGSAVGIVTGYWLDDRGIGVRVPVVPRIFTSPYRPDRYWSPPSLLSNGYRRVKRQGREADL